MLKCPICSSCNYNEIIVPELMFGTKEFFTYRNCVNCNCLYLAEGLINEITHYPDNYYSLNKVVKKNNLFKRTLKKFRLLLSKSNFTYSMLNSFFPQHIIWLRHLRISFNAKILDVGCGNGDLIYKMYNEGYTNLYGIDPYTKNEISETNIKILKRTLEEFDGEGFDLIMLNHVLEHLDNHEKILELAKEKLKKNGVLLIRTPIVNKSFKEYKEFWVEIDAPRHKIIHSEKSLKILVEKAGFKLENKIYDTTLFEFLASEQYRKGISLFDDNSYVKGLGKSIFKKTDIIHFNDKVNNYNKLGLAGRGCYFFTKSI